VDVGAWLRDLGLGRYEEAFRENEIDAEVLSDLTDADLEKLGMPMGHRKRLLKAIAGLSSADRESTSSKRTAKIEPERHDAAERRQLTVMFCDLVGSTAMSARLDPEDMHGIIAAYHECCSNMIGDNGGFVAKYMGDGVLAYFGYPQAHEHDAEHAVRAGLAIVEDAPKLVTAAGAPLHVRVGIATGIVVVGDLLGSGEAQERGVVGDTPNLAARLQGIAEPDSVVIAEGTRKLVGNLFELVELGPRDLKGVAGPARAFAVLRATFLESRFEALHAGGLTPLVGREEENELLLQRWAKAKAGEGQVVLLSGEAGIGKSRLTAAFLERLAAEPHVRLRYFCSPQHTDSALHPIISQLERAAGFVREDDSRAKLDKLDALLARSGTSREDAALIAEMLSLPNDGRYPALALAPQQRRQRTIEELTGQIEAIARQSPALMILEDAHWADPSSLEVLSRLVDKIDRRRVLLLVTFRPEFAAPWIGRPHVTTLTLNRLPPREAMALIEQVAGNKPLPANIRQDIIERADGIPLFVEEMTKAVLEAEDEGGAARTVAAVPSPALAVPASLHASLMARLDRLGPAKGVAQIGAAIGREFSHGLITPVARLSERELTSHLDRLLQSGLLSRQGSPPHATYVFKHALVQDAAYGTLLREPRRALHARIAEVLEGQFAEIAETQPELLARHCSEAGLIEKTAHLWGKAGLRSLARSALAEASEQLARALAQIAVLSGTPELRRDQIKLQVALANVLMHVKGYAAPEPKAAVEHARLFIEQAEALGETPEDPLALFSVLYGVWSANSLAFKGDVARELAAQFLELAEKHGAIAPIMVGHRIMGHSLLFTGELARARAHYDKGIVLYDAGEHRSLAMRFGQDTRVAILSLGALASWVLGYPERAEGQAEQAVRDAREIGLAGTLMFALSVTSLFYVVDRNSTVATAQARELFSLADEKGALLWKATGTIAQGRLLAMIDKPGDAIHLLASGIEAFNSTGSTMFTPLYLSYLAEAHAKVGQFDVAWRYIEKSTSLMEANKETWTEAEVHRIAGEIALMSPTPDAARAEGCFERALAVARSQQAKSWELRAAMSMARLWRDQGTRRQALELLAPIYGWFTEGFDTLDLIEAKALLAELAFTRPTFRRRPIRPQ
jgi:class 3 adenylate cyclase/predicted ATPase